MKRVFAAFLAALMLAALVPAQSFAIETVEIHVSIRGNDSAEGSAERPLASLNGARLRVRELRKSKPDAKIDVIFHEGTYRMQQGVIFEAQDSGTKENPVTYRAAEKESVLFKGSVEVDVEKIELVTNQPILKRLPSTAVGKVGQINLGEQGIDIKPFIPYTKYTVPSANYGRDVEVFLNGIMQTCAEYPNGDDNYLVWGGMVEMGGTASNVPGTGGTFKYVEARPSGWTEAKDIYIKNFFANDWEFTTLGVESIDTVSKTIKLERGYTGYGLMSQRSCRWKAVNLLEEIDVPGEWYIDKETDILYYYPPYSLDGAQMEISVLKDDMVTLKNTSNIEFKGITFTQTCGSVFVMEAPAENITIDRCEFSNIGQKVIDSWGYTAGYMASQDKNRPGLFGVTVSNNLFYNIHFESIKLIGGELDTLTPSRHVISNNYFYNSGIEGWKVIDLRATGAVVENNFAHFGEYGFVTLMGNDNSVRYNEIYNFGRTVNDTGTLYAGRSYLMRGNEFAYNYVHDNIPIDKLMHPNQKGVYLDDAQCGVSVHHNIVKNVGKGLTVNGGQASDTYDNIVVDCSESGLMATTWQMDNPTRIEREIAEGNQMLANPAYTKYPYVAEGLTERYLGKPAFNTITGNLVIHSTMDIPDIFYQNGTVENNISVESFDDFLDPKNGDYRIKKDSKVLEQSPGLISEDFAIDKIGLQEETFDMSRLPDKSFRQSYPKNGETQVYKKDLFFSWDPAFGADQYRFVLATDSKMEHVLIDTMVDWNYFNLAELPEKAGQYYWKVYAIQDPYGKAVTWESSSVPYAFSVLDYELVDTSALSDSMLMAKEKLKTVKEGEAPGEYRIGTKAALSELIERAEKLLAMSKKSIQMEEVQELYQAISAFMENGDYINYGYADLGAFMGDPEEWSCSDIIAGTPRADSALQVKDGVVSIFSDTIASGPVGGCRAVREISKNVIFKFKLKIDDFKGAWVGLGIRGKTGVQLYTNTNFNYFFVLKEDLVEYQKVASGYYALEQKKENQWIKPGQWHEIAFGAVDIKSGQLIVLMVDGETVFEIVDSKQNAITSKGEFTFSASKGVQMSFAKSETPAADDFDKLIRRAQFTAAQQRCERVRELTVGGVIMAADTDKALNAKGEIVSLPAASKIINGMPMIPVDTAKILLGERVNIEKLKGSAKMVDGVEMTTLSALAEAAGQTFLWDEVGVMIIADSTSIDMGNADNYGIIKLAVDALGVINGKEE